jgi:glucokinase
MATIGIDVGGTKTHAVVFDSEAAPVAELRRRTAVGSAETVTASIIQTIEDLLRRSDSSPIDGIGIGIPGRVDPELGAVAQAVNLGIGAQPETIAPRIAAHFATTCRIDNDVNAAALGVHRTLNMSEVVDDLVYLSIGTGIAAGVIINGRIWRGAHGVAGEIGHLPFRPDGELCRCGLRGCLETVASGTAIARQWPVADHRSPTTSLLDAAARGDRRAAAVLQAVSSHLALAVYSLAVTSDVDSIVVGGGVAEAGQPLLSAIGESIDDLAGRSEFVRSLNLAERLQLAPDGPIGARGAAALVAEGDR